MRRGRNKIEVDVPLMFQLWNDDTLRTEDVAMQLGISTNTLRKLGRRHGLVHRVSPMVNEVHGAPSDAEDMLSRDSLALSPWVAARAEMFRKEKEKQGEPARLEIGVTTLVTAGPRRRLARLD